MSASFKSELSPTGGGGPASHDLTDLDQADVRFNSDHDEQQLAMALRLSLVSERACFHCIFTVFSLYCLRCIVFTVLSLYQCRRALPVRYPLGAFTV